MSTYKARANVKAAKSGKATTNAKLVGAWLRAYELGGIKLAAKCVASFKMSVPSASGGLKLDKAIGAKMSTGENDASNRVMLPRDRGMVARNRQRVNGANSRKGGAAYYARVKASRMVDTFIIEGQIQRAARTIVRLETRDTSTMNARDRRSHTRSLDHAEITLYHLLGIVNCPCKDCAE